MMVQGSKKAGVEGAIPAKGNAFGEAGGVGHGDTRGQKQNPAGARGLGELYPRFRDPDEQQPGAHGSPGGQPPIARSAAQASAEALAGKLSEPARNIAALLTREHAREDDEAAAGQRLAARFVRRPQDEACTPAGRSLTPYLAAAALILLAGGGAAFYLLRPESPGAVEQAGSAYVAASFNTPVEAGLGARQAQTAPAWMPQNPGTGAAQGSASDSWAETVETFKMLAGPEAAPPQDKVNEPQLEQLATGYNAIGAK